MYEHGLGKKRTKFGKWLDKNNIKQGELPIHRNMVARLCNEEDYSPYEETYTKVISYLRGKGYDVRCSDFW